eukprot:1816813-Rhodomonas_salina.1
MVLAYTMLLRVGYERARAGASITLRARKRQCRTAQTDRNTAYGGTAGLAYRAEHAPYLSDHA